MKEKTKTINIRVTEDIYEYLKSLDNFSKYIKDLINQDREQTKDPVYIQEKIKKHEFEIQRLKQL